MAHLASSTAPQATRRSARQQSRELDTSAPPSPVKGRRQGRGARSASANVESASMNVNYNMHNFDGNNLGVVPEELQEQSNDEDTVYVNHHEVQSPGGRSNYSGVTAVTSHSATAAELLRADGRAAEFPAAIVDLCSRASSIIHVLAPKGATKANLDRLTNELQKPGSVNSKSLNSREQRLLESFQIFTDEHYIQPRSVIQAAFNKKTFDGIGYASWRPDAILQKANLAKMACQVIPAPARIPQMELAPIDNTFPSPFIYAICAKNTSIKKIPTGQSRLRDHTFEMALGIRTQLALARLDFASTQHQQDYDPDEILKQTFMSQSHGEVSNSLPGSWAISLGGKNEPLSEEMSNIIIDRINEIRSSFEETTMMPNFEELERKFPWPAFKQQLALWMRARNDEIDVGISACNGADEIANKWEKEVAQRATEGSEAHFVGGTEAAMRVVGKRSKKSRLSKGNASSAPDADGDYQPEENRLPERPRGVVDHSYPIDPQLEATRLIAQQRVSQGQPSRPKSFLDSQANATRVSFDDSQPSQTPRSVRKRPREVDEPVDDEASQDAGFQSDERGAANVEQRRAAVHLANQAQQAQARRQDEEQQLGQQLGQELGQAYPVEEAQPQTQPENDVPPPTQGQIYQNVKNMAKQMTAVRSAQKVPQLRKPWTIAETDSLIDLIGEFGSAYSLAKKTDEKDKNLLPDRDAEAMRHKARNMKYDYIK